MFIPIPTKPIPFYKNNFSKSSDFYHILFDEIRFSPLALTMAVNSITLFFDDITSHHFWVADCLSIWSCLSSLARRRAWPSLALSCIELDWFLGRALRGWETWVDLRQCRTFAYWISNYFQSPISVHWLLVKQGRSAEEIKKSSQSPGRIF